MYHISSVFTIDPMGILLADFILMLTKKGFNRIHSLRQIRSLKKENPSQPFRDALLHCQANCSGSTEEK